MRRVSYLEHILSLVLIGRDSFHTVSSAQRGEGCHTPVFGKGIRVIQTSLRWTLSPCTVYIICTYARLFFSSWNTDILNCSLTTDWTKEQRRSTLGAHILRWPIAQITSYTVPESFTPSRCNPVAAKSYASPREPRHPLSYLSVADLHS